MNIALITKEFHKKLTQQMAHLGHQFQSEPDQSTDVAVLIMEASLEKAEKEVRSVRKTLGPQKALLVCVQEISESQREVLCEAGANHVLVPSSWGVKPLADRLAGELFHLSHAEFPLPSLVGQSRKMQSVYDEIKVFARSKKDIMILGESGTGKELVARSIHESGKNANEPFIAINCAEMDANNLVSRLFGHEKGSYTGADRGRKGAFFEAGLGTVFLDEVGELKPDAQPLLLRALQERKAVSLGTHQEMPFECRILVATNKPIDSDDDNQFRGDLFARFEGFIIHLPPLRERMGDVPLLARFFIEAYNKGEARQVAMTDAALDLLMTCAWPRNVRQLSQFIESAGAFTDDDAGPVNLTRLNRLVGGLEGIQVSDSFSESDTWADVEARTWLAYAEFAKALEGGDTKKAGTRAGLSRSAFYDRMTRARDHLKLASGSQKSNSENQDTEEGAE